MHHVETPRLFISPPYISMGMRPINFPYIYRILLKSHKFMGNDRMQANIKVRRVIIQWVFENVTPGLICRNLSHWLGTETGYLKRIETSLKHATLNSIRTGMQPILSGSTSGPCWGTVWTVISYNQSRFRSRLQPVQIHHQSTLLTSNFNERRV